MKSLANFGKLWPNFEHATSLAILCPIRQRLFGSKAKTPQRPLFVCFWLRNGLCVVAWSELFTAVRIAIPVRLQSFPDPKFEFPVQVSREFQCKSLESPRVCPYER